VGGGSGVLGCSAGLVSKECRRVREVNNSRAERCIPDNQIPPRNFAVGRGGSVRVRKWMSEFMGVCIAKCSGCQWFTFRSI
jgi:hypothetical protein